MSRLQSLLLLASPLLLSQLSCAGLEPDEPTVSEATSIPRSPDGAAQYDDTVNTESGTRQPTPVDFRYRVSPRPRLQWKRYAALEADVARALDLEPTEICREFGEASCVREVHLVPLGGYDPFETGLLSASPEPLATTPAAVDRVLLSACSRRVAKDREAPSRQARVFKRLELSADAPAVDSEAVRSTIIDLYRRFLSRDPEANELSLVAPLARKDSGEPRSASGFALLSCYAIGTTTEFLFF